MILRVLIKCLAEQTNYKTSFLYSFLLLLFGNPSIAYFITGKTIKKSKRSQKFYLINLKQIIVILKSKVFTVLSTLFKYIKKLLKNLN